jgi:hypothetical protein
MSSTREYEAHNVLFPLKNSTGMVAQANLMVTNQGIVQNLASLFRGIQDGHYLTAQADGAKIYVAFGSNDVGQTLMLGLTGYTIEPHATGSGRQVCFPIPDGVMMPGVPYGGKESGRPTGHVGATTLGATLVCGYNYVHARLPTGGVATAYLRLYRSSLAPGQDPREFRPV